MTHPRWVTRFMSDADLDAMARAVESAESRTSGEIRVHLERRVPRAHDTSDASVLARARAVFHRLGMEHTRDRNAVLIYVAIEHRRLAIVGDEGVHARVGDEYWARVRDAMIGRLRQGRARDAIVEAVADVGRVLSEHFPRRPDDTDELSDRPSIG